VRLLAVNVAMPAPLRDDRTGRVVPSGIGKRPVTTATVAVDAINIAGDGQGDRQSHGGIDKAVYCYPHDHLPAWEAEIGYGPGIPAPFGENLSVLGSTEDEIRIGDRWQWGEVVLEVAQPRWPCFKLGLHAGHRDLPARLIAAERSGWYCRVVTEGIAPTGGELVLVASDPVAPTVRETFRAAKGLVAPERAAAIAAWPALAARWRAMIEKRCAIAASPESAIV
jgi:MOSC domain-containing protein YiiM